MSRVIRINEAAVEPAEPADADIVETEPGIYSIIADGASWIGRGSYLFPGLIVI